MVRDDSRPEESGAVITRAFTAVRTFAPARLSMARRLAGMRPTDLAAAVASSSAAVSQYEQGQMIPDDTILARFAHALNVPIEFFAGGRPQLRLDTSTVHFRSMQAADTVHRQQVLAQVELLWEVATAIEQVIEFPDVDLGLPLGVPHGGPAEAARTIRKAWGTSAGPIAHVVRQLEVRGILVVALEAAANVTIGAFSSAAPGRPIIALPTMMSPLARRVAVAHELGHLLLHPDAAPGSPSHEAAADAFAAEFLMPAADISDRLPRRNDVGTLKDLSDCYGVPTAMLAHRGQLLGVYSETDLQTILADIVGLGWTINEPVNSTFVGEQPELLQSAAHMACEHGMPLRLLASKLNIELAALRQLVGHTDLRPRLRLIASR
ncbi:ImmA/IrrE family metallo-endopeptidase [Kutzneria kofuensis]|uniref:Zn-dependent peptidase ImmA (M78 family) n=1 Tax=Kutzneria kofuensis TaxID=103725 RepID=A0A7W9NFH8_9PSEU|nr:ImmA/IrrE family metallo-endopeptidase [Kutzneria kofuensis]MBB5891412.1 Zn-dependent peptidase ImmA (M78 family) [Kutzneria kofuensis]